MRVKGYVDELKAIVQECPDCGCLIANGDRCKRCSRDLEIREELSKSPQHQDGYGPSAIEKVLPIAIKYHHVGKAEEEVLKRSVPAQDCSADDAESLGITTGIPEVPDKYTREDNADLLHAIGQWEELAELTDLTADKKRNQQLSCWLRELSIYRLREYGQPLVQKDGGLAFGKYLRETLDLARELIDTNVNLDGPGVSEKTTRLIKHLEENLIPPESVQLLQNIPPGVLNRWAKAKADFPGYGVGLGRTLSLGFYILNANFGGTFLVWAEKVEEKEDTGDFPLVNEDTGEILLVDCVTEKPE